MISNLNEIEKILGIESGKLESMLSSEEQHEIDLSNKVFFTKEDYDKKHATVINSTKEILIKNLKKEIGLEFDGKNEETFISVIKEKLAQEPANAVATVKNDFESIKKQLEQRENDFEEYKTKIATEKREQQIKNEFFKNIPDNTLVSKNTIFLEAKEKGYIFDIEDDIFVIKDKKGEILKDEKTYNPIGFDSFLNDFSKSYLPKVDGGAGAGDNASTNYKAGTLDGFYKEAEKNNWNDFETNQQMLSRIKEGTLKL